MKPTMQLGAGMWLELSPTFKEAMKAAGVESHKERAQVWASYLAAASGGMMMDLGKQDTLTILEGVLLAMREASHLAVVGGSSSAARDEGSTK